MNDAAPVAKASNRIARATALPCASLCSGAAAGAGTAGAKRRVISHTASASATLRRPAVRMVPGNPQRSIRKKPLASTPAAAPKLLVK